jgi:hypothetical protein
MTVITTATTGGLRATAGKIGIMGATKAGADGTAEDPGAPASHFQEGWLPEAEPRWPALVAIVTAGIVYAALPEALAVGPRWLLIVLIVALEVPTLIAHYRGLVRVNRVLGFVVSFILTGFVIWSLGLLLRGLPGHRELPVTMLRSAACLWVSNVITFALWYWRLDAGGPYSRAEKAHDVSRASFLFPQLTLKHVRWSPQFVDYLFLAFNTSTALSPTDAPVLNRWAKVLTMVQALISLTIIALLLARAVNIL